MMFSYIIVTGALSGTVILGFLYLKARQNTIYRTLRPVQQRLTEQYRDQLKFKSYRPESLPDFGHHLVSIPDFLPEAVFQHLRQEMEVAQSERTFIPFHKKGGTLSYETLHKALPMGVALYLSEHLRQVCSAIIGETVMPTPLNDQSSCSLLIYENPGDHIGWHYDHDFYHGRHFTVLLSLANERCDTPQTLSSTHLIAKPAGQEMIVPTPPNTLVIFEGAKVLHKATPLGDNEKRVLLSMTYCTNPATSLIKSLIRRGKDTAFFGIRALWT
jgi:hypothetical protein